MYEEENLNDFSLYFSLIAYRKFTQLSSLASRSSRPTFWVFLMMILTVKILPGGRKECSIEVMDQEPILSVKRMVARELDVPVHLQRLVFRGKTLSDGSALNDYNIGPNTKIHLVVRKPESETDPLSTSKIGTSTEFWEKLRSKLCKHFTQDDADKVLHQFKLGFSSDVSNLSLGDIERIALMHENKGKDTDQAGTSS